ncbi:hypothetical protein WDU94_007478 [Cyamophila willieti]
MKSDKWLHHKSLHSNGCGQRGFDLNHALCCKTGGLITRRHNEVRDLLGELCEKAWGNVTKEPLVIEDGPGLRGDLSVRGVWEAQREALFDIRVTDTDAPSYTSRSVMSVLRRAEEEKKEKYKEACEARHVTFTPLVTSVDGLFAPQFVTFVKVLAERLSERMGMEYGRMMGWLRTRIGMSVVRAASQSPDSVPNLSGQSQDSVPNLSGQSQDSVPNLSGQSPDSVPNLSSQSQDSVPNLSGQSQYSVPNLSGQSQDSVPNLSGQSL